MRLRCWRKGTETRWSQGVWSAARFRHRTHIQPGHHSADPATLLGHLTRHRLVIDGSLSLLREQAFQFLLKHLLLLRRQFGRRWVLASEEFTSLRLWCDAGLIRLAVDQEHVRAVFFRGTQIERASSGKTALWRRYPR